MKGELLNSLRESNAVEESDFDIKNITDQREAIEKTKHYDKIIKSGSKNTIRYESIQRQMLKTFKDTEGFFENVGLSGSTSYFKIGLYEFLKKYLASKNSNLSSHYFKNKFKNKWFY